MQRLSISSVKKNERKLKKILDAVKNNADSDNKLVDSDMLSNVIKDIGVSDVKKCKKAVLRRRNKTVVQKKQKQEKKEINQ